MKERKARQLFRERLNAETEEDEQRLKGNLFSSLTKIIGTFYRSCAELKRQDRNELIILNLLINNK